MKRLVLAVCLLVFAGNVGAIDYTSDKFTYDPADWTLEALGYFKEWSGFRGSIINLFSPTNMPDFYNCIGIHTLIDYNDCDGQAFGSVGEAFFGCLKYTDGWGNGNPLYAEYNDNIPSVFNIYKDSELFISAYFIVSDRYTPIRQGNWSDVTKKLIVVADGIDKGDYGERHIDDLICSPKYNTLLKKDGNSLLADGFNILFVDFADGAGDIAENAKAMAHLLSAVQGYAAEDDKISVAGFSMGGVVARLAMLYLENNNQFYTSKIDKFISIDAPQQGAAISTDLQHIMRYMNTDAIVPNSNDRIKIQDAVDLLKKPANQQLLYENVYTSEDENHKFFDFVRNMGDYPVNGKRYAIAEGNWERPYGSSNSVHAASFRYGTYSRDIYLTGHECAAGSYRKDLEEQNDDYPTFIVPLGTFVKIAIDLGEFTTYKHGDEFYRPTHIPLYSALDIRGLDIDEIATPEDREKLNKAVLYKTPFDRVFLTDKNSRREHITFDAQLNNTLLTIMHDNTDYGYPRIHLRTYNDHCLSAYWHGGDDVRSDRKDAYAWETFQLVGNLPLLTGDEIKLQTDNYENYCVAVAGGGYGFRGDGMQNDPNTILTIYQRDNAYQGIYNNDFISLQAPNGKYVVAEGGGGGDVNANRDDPYNWERFQIVGACEYATHFETRDNYFIATENGGGEKLVTAYRKTVGSEETFIMIDENGGKLKDGDKIFIKTSNRHHYLSALWGGGYELDAIRVVPLEWETFTIHKANGETGEIVRGEYIHLETANGKYVVAEYGGNGPVNANRDWASSWETFRIWF